MSEKGVVAAGHELTVQTAEAILRDGGNAFDAVLAAMCTACVAEPVLISPGGGGFLMAQTADRRNRLYDFFVHTPRRKRPEEHLDFRPALCDFGTAQQTFHIGLGSIAVPGFVRGLFAIHRDLCTMPMRDIVAPAIEHARDGVTVNDLQAYIFDVCSPIYTASEEACAIFGSTDDRSRTVREGELLRQPQLADLLEVLAIEGEDLFYRGEIAQTIDAECREGGGCLTLEDLSHYEVVLRHPLSLDYRQARVSTNPPPSSGGILIAFALELLGCVPDFHEMPFGRRAHLELTALAIESTNKARLDILAARGGGEESRFDPVLLERYRSEVLGRAEALRGTTHINVMDADDNVASMTVSNGEGCGRIVPGAGVMLNNMLGEEDLCPQGFHNWPTDQRMTSMMAPSLIQFPDGRVVATGSGGSNRIRTALLQVLVNLIDHRMSVEDAVAAPRIFWESGLLSVEGGFEERELASLLESYPRHELWGERNLFFGGAHTVEHGSGGFHGAGDPRRGGVCRIVR